MYVMISVICAALAFSAGQQPAAPQASVPLPVQQPSVELPRDLARVLTDYESAWSSRDPAALARLFAEDGFVLPGGHLPIKGRAEIARYYSGHGGPLALRAIAYGTDGKVGYIIGGYAPGKGEPDSGKFTLTLRQGADGRWLIVSDMDNANHQR